MYLSIKKLGLATGLTGAILYLGCMIVMITAGENGTISFFNSLLHGLDSTSIIRMEIPLWEAGLGIIQTFIIGWLSGACIASIYNMQTKT